MEEYTTYRLGDIAECTLGKMLDQKKNKGNPQVYLGNVAVRWGSFNVDPSQTMLFEDKELDKYQAIKGDIVLCEGGEPGRCAIWEEDRPICIQKALHRIRVNEDIASPYYVYYYLTNLVKSGKAEPFFTGSTIKHLPREKLISLELSLPCFEEQKRRAAIIRSLDDKIALNNRINHNLEEMAQALYKSWFIDFEPFKNSKFVDSELGLIPEGWRVGNIYDICDIFYGAPFNSSLFNTENKGLPLIRIRDLAKQEAGVFTEERHPKGQLTHKGDILVGMDGEFSIYIWGGEDSWINQRISRFSPKSGISHFFLIETLKPQLKAVESSEVATTVIHIGKNDYDRFSALIPHKSVLASFYQLTEPLFLQYVENLSGNHHLSESRDILLPRLMSGQLTC